MPAPSPLPRYLYKILPEAPPDPLPLNLPLSELDAKDGFIHLSTAEQIPKTISLFYSATTNLWLLKVPLDRIANTVKWDEGKSGCFPHIYGPMPGLEEIADMKEFIKGEGEEWAPLLEKDQWLV